MVELTDAQIFLAKKAYRKVSDIEGQPLCGALGSGLRAAAPFLQTPWSDPTHEEVAAAATAVFGGTGNVDLLAARDISRVIFGHRNKARLPMPKTLEERVTVEQRPSHLGWFVFLDGQWKFGGDGINRCDAEIYRLGLIERMKKDEVK